MASKCKLRLGEGKQMNIIVVPSWYINKVQPNNGSFFRQQAKCIAERGHNVVVLDASLRVRKGWLSGNCMKFTKIKDENISVYSYNFPSLFFGRFPLVYTAVYTLALKYLVNKLSKDGFKADVVHAHSAYAAGYSVHKISNFKDIPVVVTEHNSIFNKKITSKALKFILIQTIRQSDKFIGVSQDFVNEIINNLKSNTDTNAYTNANTAEGTISDSEIEVIPNMISRIFTYSPRVSKEIFIFLSIGNLLKIKRMDMLIKAFMNKFAAEDKVQLRIVGAGEQLKDLEKLINGRENQIKLLGEKSQEEILNEYKNCEAFVLASTRETFGIVYREAMAVGRPVISTLNGGISDDISPMNGIFLENDTQQYLEDALGCMVNNIETFDGQAISDKCIEKYSPDNVTDQIINIYNSVIKNKYTRRNNVADYNI
jgi:L-malate glycosyltransferase